MSKFTYQVVKETPGYHIDSYSEMEVVSEYDTVEEAMKDRYERLKTQREHEHHFVRVGEFV